jgi:hypothetical protein
MAWTDEDEKLYQQKFAELEPLLTRRRKATAEVIDAANLTDEELSGFSDASDGQGEEAVFSSYEDWTSPQDMAQIIKDVRGE